MSWVLRITNFSFVHKLSDYLFILELEPGWGWSSSGYNFTVSCFTSTQHCKMFSIHVYILFLRGEGGFTTFLLQVVSEKKALNSYFCFYLFLGLSTFLLSFLFLLNENSFFLWQTNFYAVFKAKLSPCLGLLMFFKLGFELFFPLWTEPCLYFLAEIIVYSLVSGTVLGNGNKEVYKTDKIFLWRL